VHFETVSTLAAPPERLADPADWPAATPEPGARPPRRRPIPTWVPTLVGTLLTAGVLCFVGFYAGGGLRLSRMTTVEIALTLGSAVIVACALLLGRRHERWEGLWPVGLLVALVALTALSVAWSVQPDDSFKDTGRMLAYAGVFAAAVVLAGVTPQRWPALLGGMTLAAVVVCGYALLTKVFPDQLDAGDIYARLRAPYSYWNAIGLTAAIGVIGCMWLGARRAGHGLLSALAYPAMGLMLVTLLLAYSRGALVALAVALALWFCIVPLRLRGAAVLVAGAVAAAGVVAWDFSTHALSTDNIAIADRTSAGHKLGALLVVMLVVLTLAGVALGFLTGRRAPSRRTRRRAGALLLALLAVAIVGFLGALAVSHRGLTGSISHGLRSLTDPHAPIPPNTPGRLTAIGSVRARYWNEALKVFKAHPAVGVGAEGYATARLRYRTETLDVRHAHGYIVQTLADLGIVGLALTLALLAAWMAAAGRCTHPFNRRWTSWGTLADWRSGSRPRWQRWRIGERPAPYTPERIGMLSLLCVVVVFGIHSLADWTWYVPGNACVALICAGWLAGRGPIERAGTGVALEDRDPTLPAGVADAREAAGPRAPKDSPAASSTSLRERLRTGELHPARVVVAGAVIVVALLAAWAQWQPQRSSDSSQQALALLARYPGRAEAAARAGVARDPLSAQALFTLATVQQASGQPALARSTLQHAVRLQPSNPQTWLTLGEYDLATRQPLAARNELAAAIYLNPEWIAPQAIAAGNPEAITIQNSYIEALRATTPAPTPITARRRSH